MEPQRRSLKIAMTTEERDGFLTEARTCRVATVGADGAPHVTPMWFAWDGTALWLTSIIRSQRWADVQRNPRIGVVVDAGSDYMELRGVEISGTAVQVGEAPRAGEPVPELEEPERLYAGKYAGGVIYHDGRHAWLRVTPSKAVSWDFRKLAAG